jgi:hypothetical protein
MTPRLILAGLGLLAGASARANEPPAPSGPPSRIELPVIPTRLRPCGRSRHDHRLRPNRPALPHRSGDAHDLANQGATRRSREPASPPRGDQHLLEPGPFGCREEGVIPIGAMAFKAVELAVKAVRGRTFALPCARGRRNMRYTSRRRQSRRKDARPADPKRSGCSWHPKRTEVTTYVGTLVPSASSAGKNLALERFLQTTSAIRVGGRRSGWCSG